MYDPKDSVERLLECLVVRGRQAMKPVSLSCREMDDRNLGLVMSSRVGTPSILGPMQVLSAVSKAAWFNTDEKSSAAEVMLERRSLDEKN